MSKFHIQSLPVRVLFNLRFIFRVLFSSHHVHVTFPGCGELYSRHLPEIQGSAACCIRPGYPVDRSCDWIFSRFCRCAVSPNIDSTGHPGFSGINPSFSRKETGPASGFRAGCAICQQTAMLRGVAGQRTTFALTGFALP